MSIRFPFSSRTVAVLGVLVFACVVSQGYAVDLNTAAQSATSQVNGSKNAIATLAGSVLGLIGLIYTAIHIGGYMKTHQVDHLFKIGGGIIALAVGTALILTF